jgi:hypothetical protein
LLIVVAEGVVENLRLNFLSYLFLYHIRRIQSQFKPYIITQKKLGLGLKPKPRIDQKEKQECESILPNVKPNVKNLNIKYFSLVFFKFLS